MTDSPTQPGTFTVPRSRIIHPEEFQFRRWPTDVEHVRMLVSALRNGSVLPPIVLWEDGSRRDGKLVLLDGAHRLAALHAAHSRADVAAVIFSGTKAEAVLRVYEANGKVQLALSLPERADGAWRLVRLGDPSLKKPAIAKATGVSQRTVLTMKRRWAELVTAGREEAISGMWFRDRQDRDNANYTGKPDMSDAQRKTVIEGMARRVRDVTGQYPNRDLELVADALFRAFGARLLKEMADYLFASDEFERAPEMKYANEFSEADIEVDF